MTEFYIVGLAAIAGFAIQSGNYSIMFIAPAYAIFIYEMILGTYFYTDSLAAYIREEIESKKIPNILGKVPPIPSLKVQTADWKTRWLGWETNFKECLKEKNKVPRKKVLYFFTLGIVLVSTFSTAYGLIQQNISIPLVAFLVLTMLLAYGSITQWILQKSLNNKTQCMIEPKPNLD